MNDMEINAFASASALDEAEALPVVEAPAIVPPEGTPVAVTEVGHAQAEGEVAEDAYVGAETPVAG